ncbi:MAG: hypothetical protein JSW59_18990 [Phycisphaerales bacterium]|nr:MAG: hypothetical protein JSW59_18990 [Phycisphaerales bacterium]
MKTKQIHNPLTSRQVVDRYFLEHRAKLIDIAAFLDRVDRSGGMAAADIDYRVAALLRALDVLSQGQGDRAARILAIFSDHIVELTQSAKGVKGATGAAKEEGRS